MKHTLGVSAGFHDAALTLLDQHGKIVFAGHSERYSKQKNDADISVAMLDEIDMSRVDTVAYYERPWLKQLRQLYSGQGIEWNKLTTGQILKQQLPEQVPHIPHSCHSHHLSHAAGGFQAEHTPVKVRIKQLKLPTQSLTSRPPPVRATPSPLNRDSPPRINNSSRNSRKRTPYLFE
jgi:hypothetical protein